MQTRGQLTLLRGQSLPASARSVFRPWLRSVSSGLLIRAGGGFAHRRGAGVAAAIEQFATVGAFLCGGRSTSCTASCSSMQRYKRECCADGLMKLSTMPLLVEEDRECDSLKLHVPVSWSTTA